MCAVPPGKWEQDGELSQPENFFLAQVVDDGIFVL